MREHYIPTTNVVRSRFIFMNVRHVGDYVPMAARAMDYYEKKQLDAANWVHALFGHCYMTCVAIEHMADNIDNYVVR